MTLALATGRRERRPCRACGLAVDHDEVDLVPGSIEWLCCESHTAPCGLRCIGGGVKPVRTLEDPSGLASVHTSKCLACGSEVTP